MIVDELGFLTRGYPIGFTATPPNSKKSHHYLFNHVRIIVRYHEDPLEFEGSRIVGFEVVPFSIKVQSVIYLHVSLICNTILS